MTIPYQTIHSFFDAYGLVHARSILQELIKKADSGKSWNRSASCDVLFFTEKLTELLEAAWEIADSCGYRPEIVLDKETKEETWMLTAYDTYCGFHRNNTPWDFFPRHLTKKEFLDPYKALEKFTRFRELEEWKQIIKDLAYYALSETPLNEFDDSKSILRTYIHLNKLIEATHLIEVRFQPDTPKPRRKWEGGNQKKVKTPSAVAKN